MESDAFVSGIVITRHRARIGRNDIDQCRIGTFDAYDSLGQRRPIAGETCKSDIDLVSHGYQGSPKGRISCR